MCGDITFVWPSRADDSFLLEPARWLRLGGSADGAGAARAGLWGCGRRRGGSAGDSLMRACVARAGMRMGCPERRQATLRRLRDAGRTRGAAGGSGPMLRRRAAAPRALAGARGARDCPRARIRRARPYHFVNAHRPRTSSDM